MEILSIRTIRLTIRHLELSDLSNFHIYRSNPEVAKYQGFDVMTMEQAKNFIKDNSTKHFGKVFLNLSEQVIAFCLSTFAMLFK